MKLRTYKSLWGMTGTLEQQLRQIAEGGYDGVETGLQPPEQEDSFKDLLRKYKLDYIPMLFTSGKKWHEHLDSFKAQLRRAVLYSPQLINVHSGRDWFTPEDQISYFETALAIGRVIEDVHGIPVLHETHRTRMLFSPRETGVLLRKFPELKLTADFSHWTVVCESMLDDQLEDLTLACERTWHIHGRVGHEEGAQVPDPRAPEYKRHVEKHEQWWASSVATQRKLGRKIMTFTPEFGPPNYMQAMLYTRQPVADLWEVCKYITDRFRKQFDGAEMMARLSDARKS
jgi:hypothetical protein